MTDRKEYMKNYYEKNKKQIKRKAKINKLINKNKIEEYQFEYRKENTEAIKKQRKEHYNKNKEDIIRKRRQLKYQAFECIAKFYKTEIKCWKCGENRIWCLTIGHINQDGFKDTIRKSGAHTLYRRIIDKSRSVSDLQIECMNCNCCLSWYGKYPDEMTKEYFFTRKDVL